MRTNYRACQFAAVLLGLVSLGVSAAPNIASITPTTYAPDNADHVMIINGSGFEKTSLPVFTLPQGTPIDGKATKLTFLSSAQLSYKFNPGSDAGQWRLAIRNPDGQLSNTVAFDVVWPPRTRKAMLDAAKAFSELKWTMSAANERDECYADNYLSTFFGGGDSLTGMAYEWGGGSDIATFLAGIANNEAAGNTCTVRSIESEGAQGVDCSGFITRVWGLPRQHFGTVELETVSLEIEKKAIRLGDILLKTTTTGTGRHVVLVTGFDDDHDGETAPPWVTESVGAAWIVKQSDYSGPATGPWTSLEGYKARRYKNVSDNVSADIRLLKGVTVSPTSAEQGQSLTCSFDLKEGYNVAGNLEEVKCVIVRMDTGAVVLEMPSLYGVSLAARGTKTYSGAALIDLPVGSSLYKAVARVRKGPSSDWTDATSFGFGYQAYKVFSVIAPKYALSVSKSGSGSGTVAGSGVNCGSVCTAKLASGTAATLTATAAVGSVFDGWSGACSGLGKCYLTMSAPRSVTATFRAGAEKPLAALDIVCPAALEERSGVSCTATASYEDGKTANVTNAVKWTAKSPGKVSAAGVLTLGELTEDKTVLVTGTYASGGVTKTDSAIVAGKNVDPPTPTSPTPGTTSTPGPVLLSTSVSLNWGASVGAAYYDFSVMDVTAGTPGSVFLKDQAGSTSFSAVLGSGKKYRWQVKACNVGCSSATTWRYFQTPAGGGGIAEPTVSSISPTAMAADGLSRVLTVNGANFVAGNVVQFKWGVGAGAGVWNTGNAPTISSASLLTVNMNPGTVNDAIYARVCRSAAQTTDSDCSAGSHAITVTAPVANPFIRVADVVVGEGAGHAEFVVRLSAPSAETVTVGYYTSGATASVNDFVDVGTTMLVFAPGETLKTVLIEVKENSSYEYTEFFRLRLTGPVNATLGSAEAIGSIIDNDAPAGTPVIRISDPVVDEAAADALFAFTLDRPSVSTVSVDYATAPGTAASSDFGAVGGVASFAPGQTAVTVRVGIVDDALAEADEQFDLVLSSALNATIPDPKGTATIGRNDQPTVVAPSITSADLTVGEGDVFAQFVVRLSAPSAETVTVGYYTSGATASVNDFVDVGTTTLVFAPGETLKMVRIGIKEDASPEYTEYFRLRLTGPVNATLGSAEAIGSIIDNDASAGTPVMRISDPVVDEAEREAAFVLSLDRPGLAMVGVDYATTAGSAGGSDFTATSGTARFMPGETAVTVRVPIIDDALAEGDEQFDLVLSSALNATLPDPRGRATIGRNDQPTVAAPSITSADLTVGEGDVFAQFVVRLSAPSAETVTVGYYTSGATASVNDFVDVGTTTLVFAPGETLKMVRIGIKEDASPEYTEYFRMVLTSPVKATLARAAAIGAIIDNDASAGTPVMRISDPVVDEAEREASFVLSLDRPGLAMVSVDYTMAAGSAGGSDFTATSGTARFLPGEMAVTVRVPVIDDALAEGDEQFDLVLSNVLNATLPDPRGTATIGRNDQPTVVTPSITSADVTVGEGAVFAEFQVRLSAPSAEAVTVGYYTDSATADINDYVDVSTTTLVFAPGETLKTVHIGIKEDSLYEYTQFFRLILTSPVKATLARSGAIGTIIDNDATAGTPVIRISDPVVDEAAREAAFVLSLDRPGLAMVSVDYTTAAGSAGGSDFTATSGTARFLPGETAVTVRVPVIDDALAEADEQFDLVLSSVLNATLPDPRGTATIGRNDQPPVATPSVTSADLTVGEGDVFAQFVVRLSAPSAETVTVGYYTSGATASVNDFVDVGTTTLVFAPGETLKTVRIGIKEDSTVESDETFTLRLQSPTNATIGTGQVLCTIVDNDG